MQLDFWLSASDGCPLYVQAWGTELTNPKAVIIISHGMTEHIGRYGHVAHHFNEQGFIVYGDDHRGHGQTGKKQGQLGYIAEEDGFRLLVEDLHLLLKHVQKMHPSLPIFIFGHSMGSFIARNFIQDHSTEVDGVILSGSGYFPAVTAKVGLELAALQEPTKESALMDRLIFGSYNNKILNRLTSFDWLSRDRKVVEEYIRDPLSGYIPTAGFFVDLLSGILSMQDEKKNENIRKDLPLLFISGDADPVGNYGKGVFQAAESYMEAGLENIIVALYPEARHELHNEINKGEVFHLIDDWLMSLLE